MPVDELAPLEVVLVLDEPPGFPDPVEVVTEPVVTEPVVTPAAPVVPQVPVAVAPDVAPPCAPLLCTEPETLLEVPAEDVSPWVFTSSLQPASATEAASKGPVTKRERKWKCIRQLRMDPKLVQGNDSKGRADPTITPQDLKSVPQKQAHQARFPERGTKSRCTAPQTHEAGSAQLARKLRRTIEPAHRPL